MCIQAHVDGAAVAPTCLRGAWLLVVSSSSRHLPVAPTQATTRRIPLRRHAVHLQTKTSVPGHSEADAIMLLSRLAPGGKHQPDRQYHILLVLLSRSASNFSGDLPAETSTPLLVHGWRYLLNNWGRPVRFSRRTCRGSTSCWKPDRSLPRNIEKVRLEAYIAAARRGAKVRVLLDAYFDNQDLDSPRSNLRTVEYLSYVAQSEELDLQARRRNPTGLGIHNKMVLARTGGRGWAVAGSLNGGEVSAKLNREMALLVGSDEVYDYLADVFRYDWDVTP